MIKLKELISEKCWKGYEKKGTKKMFGKIYPNCVKKKRKSEGKLAEGKYKFKGKYLTMPGGEVSSIPKRNDRDRIIFQIKNEKFKLYDNGFSEFYLIGDRNDYYPKGEKDLLRFLNKHKAKYIGIGKR